MNRLDACRKFLAENPQEQFGPLHVVVDDWNFYDHNLLSALDLLFGQFMLDIKEHNLDSAERNIKLIGFTLSLAKLPLPEGWEEEDDEPDSFCGWLPFGG